MAHGSRCSWLGLLLVLAGTASAATVGPVKGRPVAGRPLEVNIPFTVDEPADRACASANVRYGAAAVPRTTLHVQGRGLKRNLLLTSPANVNDPVVTVNVRVGCGSKAVTKAFTLVAGGAPVAKAAATTVARPAVKQVVAEAPVKPAPRPARLATPGEPLFPPPMSDAPAAEAAPPKADPSTWDELRRVQAEAMTTMAQLQSTRKELAAVLDVERRTAQTLINADHQVRDAQSEVARMRLLLKLVGAGLALAAAGLVWFEVNRVLAKRRAFPAQPAQEPTILAGAEMPT